MTSVSWQVGLQQTCELDGSVAWLLLPLSSLVQMCTCAWAHLQFALTSSKTKLLSRIPTAGTLETEAQREFVFSDSACASTLDGRLHKLRSDVKHRKAETAPLGSPGVLRTHSPWRPYTLASVQDRYMLHLSAYLFRFHSSSHICRYSNTHTWAAGQVLQGSRKLPG